MLSSDLRAHPIPPINHSCPLRSDLTGRGAVARRDVQRRVLGEEVPRAQVQRHGLRRHDRIVFRGREMVDAERVPEHDIGVIDPRAGVCRDPFRETTAWLAGRLRDMPTGGV